MKEEKKRRKFFLKVEKSFYIFFTLIFYLLFFSENLKFLYADNNIVNNTNFLHLEGKDSFPVFLTFPNPFTNYTFIYVKLPTISDCVISIYDLFGNLIKKFYLENKNEYVLVWDATNENSEKVAMGGYVCVLSYGNKRIIRKIGYIK